MNKIIVIAGPTGIGKTRLSIELAKELNGEVINADAMQVYKELNIGTAKITEEEKCGIPHHLFDICDVNEFYTVKDYQKDCRDKISEIISRGNTPIIVGGTGLYIKSALYNYEFSNEDINKTYDDFTNQELYDLIKKNTNEDVHINNRKRMIRILQKYDNDNLNQERRDDELLYDNTFFIGLTVDRNTLYEILDKRVDKQIASGLVEEVKTLYDRGIRSKSVTTGIGYKELYKYFDNSILLDEAIDLIKKNTRHYAKRQYTWFNNKMNMTWVNVNIEDFNKTVSEVLDIVGRD